MEAEEGVAAEGQTPQWLQENVPEAELSTQFEKSTPEEISSAEELPDWLQEMEVEEAAGQTSEPVVDEIIATEPEPADEIPDWLKEMESEAGETIVAAPEAMQIPETSEELPDWLQEMEVEETEAEPSEELPDWVRETDSETESDVQLEPAVDETEMTWNDARLVGRHPSDRRSRNPTRNKQN